MTTQEIKKAFKAKYPDVIFKTKKLQSLYDEAYSVSFNSQIENEDPKLFKDIHSFARTFDTIKYCKNSGEMLIGGNIYIAVSTF